MRDGDRRLAARRQPRTESRGRPALPATCRETREGAQGGRQPRRSTCALPARQTATRLDTAAPDDDHADAEAIGPALRSERDVPADLHGRTAVPRRSNANM